MTDATPDRLDAERGRPSEPPTSSPSRAPAAERRRGLRLGPTVLASLATFLVLFEFLAFQLTAGNDPALGTAALTAQTVAQRPARANVLNRRVIKTRVVHLPPKQPAAAVTAAASPSLVPAASTPTAAPAPTAAPVPAPAPAPAPAPPVTSTS